MWSKDKGKSAREAAQDAKEQAQRAKLAAAGVQQAIDKVEAVASENKTRFLNAVSTIAERDSKYPNPSHGDTVRVTGETKVYRFETDTGWVVTDQYNPTAIDQVTQQLADTVTDLESYVNQKVQASNLQWKMSFATLTDLQSAYPTGDSSNHVVLADGYIYTYFNDNWMNTNITANAQNIADSTVSPEKTTFAKKSANLFDESTVIYGKKANTSSGQLEESSQFAVSDYIPVNETDTYKRNKVAEIVLYDSSFNRVTFYGGSTTPITINTGIKYARLNIPVNNLFEFQFEKGDVSTAYSPFGVKIENLVIGERDLADDSVSGNKLQNSTVKVLNTDFVEIGENLFNVNEITEGYLLGDNGSITVNALYNFSDFIEIKPNTLYNANKSFGYVLYDKNKKYITGRAQSTAGVTTTAASKFIRLSILNTQLVGFAFSEGASGYTGYEIKIKNQAPLTQSFARALAVNKESFENSLKHKDYAVINVLSLDQKPSSPTGKAKVSGDFIWRNNLESYKVLTMGLPSVELKINLTNPLSLNGVQEFDLAVYIPNLSGVSRIELNIVKDIGSWSRVKQQSELKQGWNFLRYYMPESDTSTWNTASAIRVIVYTVNNANTEVYVSGLQAVKPNKAKILMVCDHGYSNFKATAFEQLKTLGVPTTWAINPGRLGTKIGTSSQILTQSEIEELAIDPYAEFSFHTWNPVEKPTSNMTPDELRIETQKCLYYLRKNGLMPKYLWRAAFVQNLATNANVIQGMVESYASPKAGAGMEVYPFRDSWNINRVELHGKDRATVDSYFDRLKKTHGTFVFYTHDISSEGGIHMTPAELSYFVSKVEAGVSEGWLEGVTYSQLRTRYEDDFQHKGLPDFFN